MDITKWKDTWGTIDWWKDSENSIIQKIKDLYHKNVDFNMMNECDSIAYKHPLHYAAIYSSARVVELMMDGGAEVNQKDVYGYTPLHYAARNDKRENLNSLLKYGQRDYVNKQSYSGTTALYEAVNNNRVSIVKTLIDAGADVNIQKTGGRIALHFAADNNFEEIVKILIEAGADVNAKDEEDWTPLHAAASNDCVETVKILIERGADVNAEDDRGYKPSERTDNLEIKKLIKNAKQIRADYLAKHPQKSLPKTSGKASAKPNKMVLVKNSKTR